MALSTYSDLAAALPDWLDGSPLGSRIPDLIALATDEINAQLATALESGVILRPMIERDQLVIDAEYVALPVGTASNSLAIVLPVSLEITTLTDRWMVDYISPKKMVALQFDTDGGRREVSALITGNPPQYYTIVGSNLRFWPAPQDGDSFGAEFTRLVKVPDISESAQTNWVISNHRNVYLYGALAQAELFGWNDKGTANYGALFANAIQGIVSAYQVPTDSMPLRSEIGQLLPARRGINQSSFISGLF